VTGGNELGRLDDFGTMTAGYEFMSFDDLHPVLLVRMSVILPDTTTLRVAGTIVNP
jgi:hypothetical protein